MYLYLLNTNPVLECSSTSHFSLTSKNRSQIDIYKTNYEMFLTNFYRIMYRGVSEIADNESEVECGRRFFFKINRILLNFVYVNFRGRWYWMWSQICKIEYGGSNKMVVAHYSLNMQLILILIPHYGYAVFQSVKWAYNAIWCTCMPHGKMKRISVIKTEPFVRHLLLSRNGVNIGWSACRIQDHVSILQCYKCLEFEHLTENCTKRVWWCFCAGDHANKSCVRHVM